MLTESELPHPNACNICGKIHTTYKCPDKLEYERNLYKKLREDRLSKGLCVKCGQETPVPPNTRCENCLKKRRHFRNTKRKVCLEEGQCINCGCTPVSESCKELCETCRLESRARSRKLAHRYKVIVMDHYGQGRCSCCGETLLDFLAIDHIDGKGAAHRRQLPNSPGGDKFYLWLIKHNFPSGYQVLCFNCNFGKHYNSVCPHKSDLKSPDTKSKRRYLDTKLKVMAAYGGYCNCCGVKCHIFLNIDHIHGRTDNLKGDKLYRWLIKNNFPPGFQVLCSNCNISKYLSETCVHNTVSTT